MAQNPPNVKVLNNLTDIMTAMRPDLDQVTINLMVNYLAYESIKQFKNLKGAKKVRKVCKTMYGYDGDDIFSEKDWDVIFGVKAAKYKDFGLREDEDISKIKAQRYTRFQNLMLMAHEKNAINKFREDRNPKPFLDVAVTARFFEPLDKSDFEFLYKREEKFDQIRPLVEGVKTAHDQAATSLKSYKGEKRAAAVAKVLIDNAAYGVFSEENWALINGVSTGDIFSLGLKSMADYNQMKVYKLEAFKSLILDVYRTEAETLDDWLGCAVQSRFFVKLTKADVEAMYESKKRQTSTSSKSKR